MHPRGWAFVFITLFVQQTAPAAVLYQASGTQFPEDQGWLFYFAPGATRSADSSKTTFDSGAESNQGGWSNTFPIVNSPVNSSFPTLDRTNGFTLNFNLRVVSEAHSSTNRAGLSIILLGSDHQGIELGFWTNEVWAQSGSDFLHAEGVTSYDTTVARNYALTVLGSTYTLNDGTSNILTGSVRNYSTGSAPYSLNNYLFIGDDTTSATGKFELSKLEIVVPEPASLGMLFAVVGALACRRRRS